MAYLFVIGNVVYIQRGYLKLPLLLADLGVPAAATVLAGQR